MLAAFKEWDTTPGLKEAVKSGDTGYWGTCKEVVFSTRHTHSQVLWAGRGRMLRLGLIRVDRHVEGREKIHGATGWPNAILAVKKAIGNGMPETRALFWLWREAITLGSTVHVNCSLKQFPWSGLLGLSFGVCFLSFFLLKYAQKRWSPTTYTTVWKTDKDMGDLALVGLGGTNFQKKRWSSMEEIFIALVEASRDVKQNAKFMGPKRLTPLRLVSGLRWKYTFSPMDNESYNWRKDMCNCNYWSRILETEGKKHFLNKPHSRKNFEI